MTIRQKVLYGSIISIISLVIIGCVNFLMIYQLKEDTYFSKQILKLLQIQESMNELINSTIYEYDIQKLPQLKEKFVLYEKNFEALKDELNKKDEKDYIDYLIKDVQNYSTITNNLVALFDNEHSIELIFDTIYDMQVLQSRHNTSFDIIYPQENDLRKILQEKILNTHNIILIQLFSDLRYYSKETLYQHKDNHTLDKWLKAIDDIIYISNNQYDKKFTEELQSYKQIVLDTGTLSIKINDIQNQEQQLIIKLHDILKQNKQNSENIENMIAIITEDFLSSLYNIQYTLTLLIVILMIFISVIVSYNLKQIISKLINGVQSIENGQYDVNIQISDKEFNTIAHTFNNMANNIKQHNDQLEQKIYIRTKQLQEQKNTLENLANKLAKYLSPQIFESIFSGNQDVILESKRKYLTVFFSDIKGFTDLTDTLESEAITSLLNEYLETMSNIAIKYGGTIDKYIGDSIMIFYGDPSSSGKQQDAINCVKMAIEMKEEISKLRLKWQRDGISNPFNIRIGINSGYCTVGNFGSKNRLDYTIIGGVVNLASRLEANATSDQILISSETYSLINHNINCTKQSLIKVKGIAHDVQTYEVIDTNHSMIISEAQGLNIIIDLNQIDKQATVSKLQNIIDDINNS